METFEYKMLRSDINSFLMDDAEEGELNDLNKLGKEGWELVSTVMSDHKTLHKDLFVHAGSITYILKRKLS